MDEGQAPGDELTVPIHARRQLGVGGTLPPSLSRTGLVQPQL